MGRGLQGRVLIVAGSDPSGGAGIQADIKTVTALGGYAAAAISALTVQNTLGVFDVMAIPPKFVAEQMRAVLDDIGADCIKTGMLFDSPMIEGVATLLQDHACKPALVVDPVMVATSGDSLLASGSVDALKQLLIPKAALVTPNIPEAEALTGVEISNLEDMKHAGDALLAMGAKAVWIKGGHLKGDCLLDVLATAKGNHTVLETSRINSRNTHGTGCTAASAAATYLALGQTLEDAFGGAHRFVRRAIECAPNLGAGYGPLGHATAGNP